ncbi:hypothetical protein [Pseudomonas sp. PDM04]|uniref:hypothetical protein n=1 Tax=Pseudomonas sp. PDM04 TaxID=2769296 RepID=UPI00177B5CA9|nr:hypothetical protein [Pseudomonas sp. PDM04]MBD9442152.1 hypothetical protein [Pseudomonas sp. PDM04]
MNILYRQALTWISKSSQRYFNFSQCRIFPEVVTRIDGSREAGNLTVMGFPNDWKRQQQWALV